MRGEITETLAEIAKIVRHGNAQLTKNYLLTLHGRSIKWSSY